MAISYGPKLGLINNANIGETYYDAFRVFLQAIDAIVQLSAISASVSVPPTNPNNGDTYILATGVPSGAWTGYSQQIAVWNTQVTTSGTNTQVPAWVFYKPNQGWTSWVQAIYGTMIFDGFIWVSNFEGSVQAETPTGAANGTNKVFTLTYNPNPLASLSLYVNGVFQVPYNGVDYTIVGTTITLVVAPNPGSTIYAVYDYA